MIYKVKTGISESLLRECFCSRREAACQQEKHGIYLSDQNSGKPPSFQLISLFFIFLWPPSPFLFFPSDRLYCATEGVPAMSWGVCFTSACVFWAGQWFLVLFFWQRKPPSEWKKPTCHSKSVCTAPGILNCLLCVYLCECACLRVKAWVSAFVCVCVIEADITWTPYYGCHVRAVCWQICRSCFAEHFKSWSNPL